MSVVWLLAGVIVAQAVLLWATAGRLESRWAQAALAGGVGFLYSAFMLHLPPSLTAGQRVLVKVGTKTVRGLVTTVGEQWDVDGQEWVQTGEQAQLNDIVRFVIRLADPVAVDDYYDDRATGGFLVIDPASGATLAAGMVGDPLTRAFDPSI